MLLVEQAPKLKKDLIMKRQHLLLLIAVSFGLVACASVPAKTLPEPVINQFQAVWDQINSDVANTLPQDKVSFGKLVAGGKNIILGDSIRTLDERANILQPFNKLAHPNGICFKGVWSIDSDSRYSGYFKKGSEALIIVRASTAMSNTRSGEIRSFGFAGKIFPTMNPYQVNQDDTANFFLIDDLGGTRAQHYTDVALTNEPSVSKNSEVLKNLLYVLKLVRSFSKADKNPGIRQVYEISELGTQTNETIVTPRWMKVEEKSGQAVNAKDFRDELSIKNNKNLVFNIFVASNSINSKKDWKSIGTITLNTSVVSKSCDHRLHFHHPKWRSDLKH